MKRSTLKSDYAKKYSVKIKYYLQGSGVLVKADNHCYLFTAKHNFKEKKNDDLDKVIWNKINFSAIHLKMENTKNITIKNLVYEYDDLVIFSIKGEFQDLDSIQILQHNSTDEMDYFFFGYPAKKLEGNLVDKLRSRNNIDKYNFEVTDPNSHKTKYLEGHSGSGLFILEDKHNINYLCGIVLQSDDNYKTIINFNLSSIIVDINKKLEGENLTPILIKKYNFYIEDIVGMYSWINKNHLDNFLVRKVNEAFGKEHEYEDLIEPSPKLEKLNQYMKTTQEFEVLEFKYTQKLADMYLLGAFVASKYQDEKEALIFLNKARKYRPEYALFLSDIEKENSKDELFNLAKVAYIEYNYGYSYDCFQKILSLKLEKNEKIELYEYLVKITKYWDNRDKSIEYYRELLYLYSDEYQKAIVFYELSLLDKKRSRIHVNNGLRLIDFSSHIELKYLLYKKLYELTEDKGVYIQLKSILEELIRFQPKYKYELSTLRYGETLNIIGWSVYISIFSVVLLLISLGNLYKLWILNTLLIPVSIFVSSIIIFLFFRQDKNLYKLNIVVFLISFLFILSKV